MERPDQAEFYSACIEREDEIFTYFVSRIGTFVLCGVLMTLGCKSPSPENQKQVPSKMTSEKDRSDRHEDQEWERELKRKGY